VVPHYEIGSDESGYTITAQMPGVATENLSLGLEDRKLTLTGSSVPLEFEGYRRAYGEFTTVDYEAGFRLADDIDTDGISAQLENGILTVTLPRMTAVRKTISVS
jgi:HSP20 family molecular chaperone IbpA